MSNFDIHYDPPTRANILYGLEHTLVGNQATYDIAINFYSVTDMMHHTSVTGDGGSVVHLLTGDTVTFDNVPKPRLARIARSVASYFGLNPE